MFCIMFDSSLLDALVAFGRGLRGAGLPVTTGQIADLARALELVGLDDRGTVFRAARATLVTRREHLGLFEREFDRFWRDPNAEGRLEPRGPVPMPRAPRHERREKFTVATYMAFKASDDLEELDVADRSGTFTADEALRHKRFSDMTPEELASVRRLIRDMNWNASLRRTRRRRRHRAGSEIDFRRVLARAARLGAVPARLPRRRRTLERRPVVLLADISGSMEKYSRLVLQFFHSVSASLPRVESFVFGTRLTRITPQLRHRDIDRALTEAAAEVPDWSGGTRIGSSLATFNRRWSRRVLRRGAIVVIVSDGLDREAKGVLECQMRYLRHRCYRLVWLNPYLGTDGYEPRAAGMAAALPFVDDFLPIHNLQSLHEFSRALASMPVTGRSVRSHGRHA